MNFVLAAGIIFAFAFPIGLMVWWKKKTGETIWCFAAGTICFILFAYVLEGLLHQAVLYGDNAVSTAIKNTPVLYMLYGSFAAGIFEETGRLFGFKFLLRKHLEKEASVAYGIGHGGIEVILALGMTYVIYLLATLGLEVGDAKTTQQITAIAGSIPFSTAVVAMIERISAMMLHIGLSMIVFVACRQKGKFWLYPAAVCFHALADMPACLYQYQVITSLALIESIAFIMGVGALLMGKVFLENYSNIAADKNEQNMM